MAKIKEFDGNTYVNMTLNDNEIDKADMDNLLEFVNAHDNVYLFGKGLCGTGINEYFTVCGFDNVRGFVTSDTFKKKLKNYKVGRDGIILSLKSDYYAEILPEMLEIVSVKDVLFLKERTKQIFVQTFSRQYLNDNLWLTLPISLHCNVNCASCNMFSPLCVPETYTLKDVKNDLQMIRAMKLNLNRINISGGEPFLNPEIVEILTYIRDIYPDLKIDLYTNGLLISNYSDEQLQVLKKCNIEFHITEYGVNTDKLQWVYKRFDDLDIQYMIDYTDKQKLFYKKVIDFEKSVPVYDYINCQYYTFCFSLFMFKGRLYKCPMALNYENINRYSEKKLELTDKDFLNLDAVTSPNQIHDFWRSRLPMCSYCPRVTETITWRRSERKIEEWT